MFLGEGRENHLQSLLELDMFLVWNTIIFDSLPMKVSIRNGAVPTQKQLKDHHEFLSHVFVRWVHQDPVICSSAQAE